MVAKTLKNRAAYMRNYYATSPKYRAYKRAYKNAYYKANPGYFLKANQKVSFRTKELIWSIKASNSCTDCKVFFHPASMEFDHLSDKKSTIGKDYWARKFETIFKEIRKCQLVCANCHKLRSYHRLFGGR